MMAPTIQNGSTSDVPRTTARTSEKKSDLICRVKYSNTLPDIPFDLKFLIYPFESNRFIQYNPTSLEKNYKYEVLTEHDLGVTIDLINRDIYQGDSHVNLDPADEKLLEEDSHAPQDSIRSRQHSRPISWLRKSEYISTEQTRFQPQNIEKIEAKVGYNVKKSLREEKILYLDRDAQIAAIEKTFEDSKAEISRHYSKPNVTPVEILPVYPDFGNWKYPCAQVIFDSDPAPVGKNIPAQIEEMSQAMIRGVMDESGEQFVAYFLPTEETLEKRRVDFNNNVPYEEEQSYEYKIAREYNWNVKNKTTKGYEESYFFAIKGDGVYYNELETRVRLSKRRVKFGQQPNNTKLVVRHRVLDASEFKQQRYREKQLEVAASDDEEEMEVDEEEPEPEMITSKKDDKDSKRESRSKSRSRSRSRSGSPPARSRSRSGSRRSRSGSRRSRSVASKRSGSGSRSRSRSASGSHRSRSGSRRSRSKSRASGSRSRSRSASGSHKSKSGSPRSRSGSRRSRSGSGSPRRSRSGSNRSRSGSRRSRSGSKRSASGSRSRSRSGSGSRRSRSGSHRSRSRSGSHKSRSSSSSSNSGSDSE